MKDCRRSLTPTGTYVTVGGSVTAVLRAMLLGPLISKNGNNAMGAAMHRPNAGDLTVIKEMLEAGVVAPVIDRVYPLTEVPEALGYFGQGNTKGKIVITV